MSSPADILKLYFQSLLLTKGKNLKIVSEREGEEDSIVSTYQTLIRTGLSTPTVLIVLVKGASSAEKAKFEDLDYTSIHVRSYKTWKDLDKLNLGLDDTVDQEPNDLDTNDLENFKMESTSETKTSKTYKFEKSEWGTITLFTDKPRISFSSNDLPLQGRVIAWIREHNFVFNKA
tara:strand:+ start:67923 stop:68447 length:525 start_codon:yes stop_codon:yes gene_type:complete